MNNWFMDDLCKEVKNVVLEKQKEFNCIILLGDENDTVSISVFFINDNSIVDWEVISNTTNRYEICSGIRKFFKRYK